LGTDPAGYLAFVLDLLGAEKFDVLLPTHEQGYLFAKVRSRQPGGGENHPGLDRSGRGLIGRIRGCMIPGYGTPTGAANRAVR